MILLMSNNAISLSEVFVDLINIVFQICVMIWSANIMTTYINLYVKQDYDLTC